MQNMSIYKRYFIQKNMKKFGTKYIMILNRIWYICMVQSIHMDYLF